ncbi:oxidoreductase [Arthrobacter sp. HLT1-21]
MNSTHQHQVHDLEGRTAVITGANSGLGLQTAIALARRGASVTLACRNEARGATALETLRSQVNGATAELRILDLSSLASVRRFAADWTAPLDLLINNAGVMATPRILTEDGFEQQLGINHLGHYALTGLLLARLREAAAPRVVSVSSLAHKRGAINFDDLNSTTKYRRWTAYNQSKIANLFFTMELDRRVKASGEPLMAVAAHPGLSNTNLTAGMGTTGVLNVLGGVIRLLGQSDIAGSLPILAAATSPQAHGGDYFGPDGPGETRGSAVLVAPVPRVLDPVIAGRLWDVSAAMTGVTFPDLPAV